LGLPRNMDGTEGEMAVAVRALGQRLVSKKAIKDKGKVDLMSAVLILQEYINARRRTNEPQ